MKTGLPVNQYYFRHGKGPYDEGVYLKIVRLDAPDTSWYSI